MSRTNVPANNSLLKKTNSLKNLECSGQKPSLAAQKKQVSSTLQKYRQLQCQSSARSIPKSVSRPTITKVRAPIPKGPGKPQCLNMRIAESLNIHTVYSEIPSHEGEYRKHLEQVMLSLDMVKCLPVVDPAVLRQKRVNLPKHKANQSRKTLIFDLDETLIHSVDPKTEARDLTLPLSMPNGEVVMTGINIRPFSKECLREASKHFEVMIFTAALKCYADPIIDFLDPSGELVQHRFYRDHCIVQNGIVVKDLRIFTGRRFQDMVLVDNIVHSFGYQLDNGIPIISWTSNPLDRELMYLIEYLPVLKESNDMREVNRNTFKLREFYRDYRSYM